MNYFVIVTFCLYSMTSGLSYKNLLETQFHSLHKEQDELKWYEMTLHSESSELQNHWIHIHNSSEYNTSSDNQSFLQYNLSFPFPFYGRDIQILTLSSAGLLLTSSDNVPSHIAPFLSRLKPRNGYLLYFETDESFVSSWTRNYERFNFEFRVILYKNGTIIFLYKNLNSDIIEEGKEIIMGIADGFSSNEPSIVVYPNYYIKASDALLNTFNNYTMISFVPHFPCRGISLNNCSLPCKEFRSNCVHEYEYRRRQQYSCTQDCSEKETKSICGSDGKTYRNLCTLSLESCRKGTNIQFVSESPCENDDEEIDLDYDENEVLKLDESKRNCTRDCSQILASVCGSDDVTYDNICLLEMVACQRKTTLSLKYNGTCHEQYKECNDICSSSPHYICGSNEKTYRNPCVLSRLNCIYSTNITIQYVGKCVDDKSLNDYEGVDCNHITCYSNWNPVCGLDNRTYTNDCWLQRSFCLDNRILMDHSGPCERDESSFEIHWAIHSHQRGFLQSFLIILLSLVVSFLIILLAVFGIRKISSSLFQNYFGKEKMIELNTLTQSSSKFKYGKLENEFVANDF